MNPRYPQVAQRAAHRCEYCGAPEAVFNFPFEIEHIIPLGCGGIDEASNWALACRSCNLHKSCHLEGIDPETQMSVGLYHPRRQQWSEHFRADTATGLIHGISTAGRATVPRLKMNSPTQIAARRQWMLLQLFP